MKKRLLQYRKVLKKDQMLYETSEYLYNRNNEQVACTDIVSLYVMAPVMVRYILWVLSNALQRGHKRLYFLARDGYSMYKIATIICQKQELPIECRYLYCSRYAWRNAEYFLLQEKALDFICLGGIDVTFQKLMYRAGLNTEEATYFASLLGFEGRMEEVLSYSQVKDIQPQLAKCRPFMKMFIQHSKEVYPAVMGYLQQEGLFDDISYALVDSGWTGSMQKSLQHLLQSKGVEKEIEGYYFGMYEYPKGITKKVYHTYYFTPKTHMRRKVYFSNSLFECIFSSPEGMTTGYRKTGNHFVPVLEQPVNPNHLQIAKTTNYLCEYTKCMLENHREWLGTEKFFQSRIFYSNRTDKTSERLLSYFMGHPLPEEAKAFGKYVFCDDVLGEETQTVAAPLSFEEIKANFLFHKSINLLRKSRKPVRESAWLEGTSVLIEEASERALRQAAFYKYVLYLRKMRK